MNNVRLFCKLAHRGIVANRPSSVILNQVRYKYNPNNPGLAAPVDGIEETDEEFDQRYVNYFSRPEIDGWELRKGINDMQAMDLVPEPKIMIEVLKACRRVNDHSLAVRYLEAVWRKANYKEDITEYLMEEIRPTINELGISTPAELGYDKPELALGDPERCTFVAPDGTLIGSK